jgi:hypothetical protein
VGEAPVGVGDSHETVVLCLAEEGGEPEWGIDLLHDAQVRKSKLCRITRDRGDVCGWCRRSSIREQIFVVLLAMSVLAVTQTPSNFVIPPISRNEER